MGVSSQVRQKINTIGRKDNRANVIHPDRQYYNISVIEVYSAVLS